jgi:hypothetical protein
MLFPANEPSKRLEPQARQRRFGHNGTIGAPLQVNQPGVCSRVHDRRRPRRVGFGRSFGVKLRGIWAVEGGLPGLLGGSKRFELLAKVSETDEIAKGDIRHIEGSGAHLGFHTGLRPAQVASDVWVSAA